MQFTFYDFLKCNSKKFFFFLLLFFLSSVISPLQSQIFKAGIPSSFRSKLKSNLEIPSTSLKRINCDSIVRADSAQNTPNRFAILEYLTIDIKEQGVITPIDDSIKIWQYRITAPNALSLGIRFGYFKIPKGARLFLYSPDHTKVLGAYTSQNNKSDDFFAIQPIESNEVIIEYEEPINPEFSGIVIINSVSKSYKPLSSLLYYNDINCPDWKNWQTVKHAVCRIIFDDTDGSYYCSGSLINNTLYDATPYFLTANHCIHSQFSASSVIAYFNYETDSCNGTVKADNQTLSGTDLCANGDETDFSLIKFRESPPDSYIPYFAGWDITLTRPSESSVIHHPNGKNKSIAYSNRQGTLYPFSISWDDGSTSPAYSHWEIVFTNGNINSGSSGAPLLNKDLNIIGQVHGGDNTTNYYGVLAKSWEYKATKSEQLKAWLDPNNSGTKVLQGTDGKVIPVANFAVIPGNPCTNAAVMLNDSSVNNPQQWKWNITPNTFKFLENNNNQPTSDTSRYPVISFLEKGNYSIKLIVKNSFGDDSITRTVEAGNISTRFINLPDTLSECGYLLNNSLFAASGNYTYVFLFDSARFSFLLDSSKLYLTLKDTILNDSSFSSVVHVLAHHGQCISNDSITLLLEIPENDKIRNSLPLHLGLNGPYDNTCATPESNEPHPKTGGCIVKDNWCYDANNPDTVVNRSLWFTFVSPANGKINIAARGMDTRIAVYDALSYQDLLNNNYSLIAANDNTVTGTEAVLNNLSLEKNRKYWLQVDANKDNKGNFSINLYSSTIELTPNPADRTFRIIFPVTSQIKGTLTIISLEGRKIFENEITVSPDNNIITLNCSTYATGMYFVSYRDASQQYAAKLIIQHNR
jgi:V8-like Glu-specific endopeptidase